MSDYYAAHFDYANYTPGGAATWLDTLGMGHLLGSIVDMMHHGIAAGWDYMGQLRMEMYKCYVFAAFEQGSISLVDYHWVVARLYNYQCCFNEWVEKFRSGEYGPMTVNVIDY